MQKVRTVIYLEQKENESLIGGFPNGRAKILELARRAIADYRKRNKESRF